MQTIQAILDQCAVLDGQTQFSHAIYVPVTLTYHNTWHPINNNPSPNDPGPGAEDFVSDVSANGSLRYVPMHNAILGVPSPGHLFQELCGFLHRSAGFSRPLVLFRDGGPGGACHLFIFMLSISGKVPFEQDLNVAVTVQSDAQMNFHKEVNGTVPLRIHDSRSIQTDNNTSAVSTSDVIINLDAPEVRRVLDIPWVEVFHH